MTDLDRAMTKAVISMPGWFPMSDAPKDHELLLLCGDVIREGRWADGVGWVAIGYEAGSALRPVLWREKLGAKTTDVSANVPQP